MLEAVELVVAEGDGIATPGVAASLAVLAGIAASDAACCAKLKKRPRGQNHHEAVPMLAAVQTLGQQMSKDLERLLNRKDEAHYGLQFVAQGNSEKMVGWARRLFANARRVLESG